MSLIQKLRQKFTDKKPFDEYKIHYPTTMGLSYLSISYDAELPGKRKYKSTLRYQKNPANRSKRGAEQHFEIVADTWEDLLRIVEEQLEGSIEDE